MSDKGKNVFTRVVSKWYVKAFPDDAEMGKEFFNRGATFLDLYRALSTGTDVYTILPGDSIVRERCFEELASIMGVGYDTVYYACVNGGF